MLNDVEAFLRKRGNADLETLEAEFTETFQTEHHDCVKRMFADIRSFIITEPRLPSTDRKFVHETYPRLAVTDTRGEIISKIRELAPVSEMAHLTLYAYRDMERTDWRPFIKAAIERNPVCHEPLKGRSPEEIHEIIGRLENESIYDSGRMAQPDEVWNFGRGDGAEKAFLMADALVFNDRAAEVTVSLHDDQAIVGYGGTEFRFVTSMGHIKKILIRGNDYKVL